MDTGTAQQSVWIPGVRQHIISYLDANEIPCNIRLLDRETGAELRSPKYITVRLSRPCPCHAFHRRWGVPEAVRSLNRAQRRQLVCLVAASGVLDNLKIALEAAGCLPHDDAIGSAAAAGQRAACTWLRSRGYPWGKALDAAARAGRRDMCEWLLAAGCPWNSEAVYAAARGGHVELMELLLQWKPSLYYRYVNMASLTVAAAEGCDLAALRRLYRRADRPQRSLRVVLQDILAAAARSPTPDWQAKVQWLETKQQEGGARPSQAAEAVAAQCSGGDAPRRLSWLRQRGYPLAVNTLHTAAQAGNAEALRYLQRLGGVWASGSLPWGPPAGATWPRCRSCTPTAT